MNIDELLLLSSLIKWSRSEPMSTMDMERLADMIATRSLNVDSAQPDELAGLRQKFQNTIRQRFFEPQQQ